MLGKNLRSLLCCVKLGCLCTGFTIIARLTNTLAKENIHNIQCVRDAETGGIVEKRPNMSHCIPSHVWRFHAGWSLIMSMPTSVIFLGGSWSNCPIRCGVSSCTQLSTCSVSFSAIITTSGTLLSVTLETFKETRSDWMRPCRAWEHPGHDTEQVGPNQPELHWQKPWRKGMCESSHTCHRLTRLLVTSSTNTITSWTFVDGRSSSHHLSNKLCIRSTSATSSRTLARRVVFLPKYWLSDVTNVIDFFFLIASDQLANGKSHAIPGHRLHSAVPHGLATSKPGPGKDQQIHLSEIWILKTKKWEKHRKA